MGTFENTMLEGGDDQLLFHFIDLPLKCRIIDETYGKVRNRDGFHADSLDDKLLQLFPVMDV